MKKKITQFLTRLCMLTALIALLFLLFMLAKEKKRNNTDKTSNTITCSATSEITSNVTNFAVTATPKVTLSPKERLEQDVTKTLKQMTLEEKVAQLFMITPEALTGYAQVTNAGNTTYKALKQYPVGGLIYFSQNISNPKQLNEMTSNTQQYAQDIMDFPIFLGIDEEGGTVARIANNSNFSTKQYTDMWSIGASKDSSNAYSVGSTIGKYLNSYGFNVNFAPDADVLTNANNQVIGKRSFGSDADLVADMVLEEMQGLEDNNVFACLKHFPGHGGTEGDTHNGYAYTNRNLKQLKNNELVPFEKGISHSVSFIMVSHISLPNVTVQDVPASLSKEIVTDLLRTDMDYDGIVITDAMNMGAITTEYDSADASIQAIQAGVDIILMPQNFHSAYEGVKNAVLNGTISKKRLNQSVRRILRVKLSMEN